MNAFVSNFYFIFLATKAITWSMAGYLTWKPVNNNAQHITCLLLFFTSWQENPLNVAKKYKRTRCTHTHTLKSQSWKIKSHSGHKLCNRQFQLACALVIMDSGIRVSGRGLGLLTDCASEPISSGLGPAARPVSTGSYITQYQNARFPNAILWGERGWVLGIKCNKRLWPKRLRWNLRQGLVATPAVQSHLTSHTT